MFAGPERAQDSNERETLAQYSACMVAFRVGGVPEDEG